MTAITPLLINPLTENTYRRIEERRLMEIRISALEAERRLIEIRISALSEETLAIKHELLKNFEEHNLEMINEMTEYISTVRQ